MRTTIKLLAALAITAAATTTARAQYSTVTQEKQDAAITERAASGTAAGRLDFLRELEYEYPFDALLFENRDFNRRLKKLLGGRRYRFLVANFDVQNPIEIDGDIFVATACKAHECPDTNFIIAYDFARDALSAGIRRDGEAVVWSENGKAPTPAKITEWMEQK